MESGLRAYRLSFEFTLGNWHGHLMAPAPIIEVQQDSPSHVLFAKLMFRGA